MARLFAWMVLWLLVPVRAQAVETELYGGFGLALGFGPHTGTNHVIDRYNETRDYLDKPMGHMVAGTGFFIPVGIVLDRFQFDLTWLNQVHYAGAQGVDASGEEVRRQLRMGQNSLGIGLGYALVRGRGVQGIFGASVDFGSLFYRTRVAPPEDIAQTPKDKVLRRGLIEATIYGQALLRLTDGVGPAALVRPFIRVPLGSVDLDPLNESLNPNTWQSDPSRREWPFAIGVAVAIAVAAGD